MSELRTERLLLREWRESDLGPWAAMNADPEVRAHFPEVLTPERSAASVARFQADLAHRGWGWWALEVRATGEFIGMTGLDPVDAEMPFTGVEAGWRLARSSWGHGYATEAGEAALAFGFSTLALPEILAVTTATNLPSQAVMRRLGMTRDPADDFDDPDVADGPLRRNVLYRISAGEWAAVRQR
ncbi:GNAT family N-acetyltransferase [Streptomyces tubercidicus]|uniref:N-acetyltransferase n=1 Tax=Streptomyces tubercidicus TaxID=47759 RepID=A0A640V455_9ACTN|nr:GNAT family N-acetyltransferase [Streptomyces tubercidicus]WAU16206.1 GNAT family N-acetyltransferase [Streptomyces tubercidicus]GFE42150.1 N-acetyltransferase [Streptomyces tubercidicus]